MGRASLCYSTVAPQSRKTRLVEPTRVNVSTFRLRETLVNLKVQVPDDIENDRVMAWAAGELPVEVADEEVGGNITVCSFSHPTVCTANQVEWFFGRLSGVHSSYIFHWTNMMNIARVPI